MAAWLTLMFAGIALAPSRWWLWLAIGVSGALLLIYRATPLLPTPYHSSRYAVPLALVIGGGGLFMIANGLYPRLAVALLLIFSIAIAVRLLCRGLTGSTVSILRPHSIALTFAASIAVFAMSVSIAALVLLLRFPVFGGIAIAFLAFLYISRQVSEFLLFGTLLGSGTTSPMKRSTPSRKAIWYTSDEQSVQYYHQVWVWHLAITAITLEVFIISLSLPFSLIMAGALVWIAFLTNIEFLLLRIEPRVSRSRWIWTILFSLCAMGMLLTTARWP